MANKILVCDDDKSSVTLVECVLESAGYEILTACDGVKALDLAHREVPDIIILDLIMPGMTGHKICEILKNDPETKNVYIIMTSSDWDALNRVNIADRIMPKPFSVCKLQQEIHDIFSNL